MSAIVIIGNMGRAYLFPDRLTAHQWAETASFTSLTDNGRTSTTILDVRDGSPFAFRVTVTVTPAGKDSLDSLDDQFDEDFTVIAYTFDEAEAKGIIEARNKYDDRLPRATYYASPRVQS